MFEDDVLTTGEEEDCVFKGKGWDYAAKRSVNAVNAEREGRFPYSEWYKMRKQTVLEFVDAKIKKLGGVQAISFNIKLLKKAQKNALLQLFLDDCTTEYHHVDVWNNGRRWRHQAVGYFGINERKLVTVTDEEITNLINSIRADNLSVKLERDARKEEEQKLRLAKPLEIGVLTERDYYKKWLDTYTTFVGVLDGNKLYYYSFPRFRKDIINEKKDLAHTRIRWKKWKEDGDSFYSFDAMVKVYPEYETLREEIENLLRIRSTARCKD